MSHPELPGLSREGPAVPKAQDPEGKEECTVMRNVITVTAQRGWETSGQD